ncbi:DUF6363 domain-containing protein [Vibrio chagasii]|nr:DUF6363 domain-containing protein [Vibrio chagasii]
MLISGLAGHVAGWCTTKSYSLTQDFLNSPPDDAFVVQIAPSRPLKSSSFNE